MVRALRIAVRAVAIYIAVSIAVAILMAEMTLHPWRRPMRDREKEKIARSYSIHGAELPPRHSLIRAGANPEHAQLWLDFERASIVSYVTIR